MWNMLEPACVTAEHGTCVAGNMQPATRVGILLLPHFSGADSPCVDVLVLTYHTVVHHIRRCAAAAAG
jgi:hypothetical protein